MLITIILAVGWPVLILMSILIIIRGRSYSNHLKNKALGQLIKPTIIGWMFGLYSVGIVSTAYMLDMPWYYTVIPVFATFLPAIVVVYSTISKWEKQSVEIAKFYSNLEVLVKEKTQELQDAYEKQLEHEKEIQKLKDQFVFIAAHELRTPVTSINWWMEIILDDEKGKKLSPELRESLTNIMNSNQKLVHLVDDLLNVARIESGTIQIKKADCDMIEIINSVIAEQELAAKAREVKIDFKNKSKKLKLFSDESRLKQVMTNLLSNAIKYNQEKGTVTITADATDGFIEVAVKDTGIGIEKDEMKILFSKFGRVKNKITEKIEGTGLGLYVSKEIVKKLGGKIWAESEAGKGTIFSFKIPLK